MPPMATINMLNLCNEIEAFKFFRKLYKNNLEPDSEI
jgi:hypothetical protein